MAFTAHRGSGVVLAANPRRLPPAPMSISLKAFSHFYLVRIAVGDVTEQDVQVHMAGCTIGVSALSRSTTREARLDYQFEIPDDADLDSAVGAIHDGELIITVLREM